MEPYTRGYLALFHYKDVIDVWELHSYVGGDSGSLLFPPSCNGLGLRPTSQAVVFKQQTVNQVGKYKITSKTDLRTYCSSIQKTFWILIHPMLEMPKGQKESFLNKKEAW